MTKNILVKHFTRHNELKQTWRNSIRLSSPKGPQKLTRAPTAGSTVRGQLHEETFYGKIKQPGETDPVCVIRKELGALKDKDIDAIVDPVIRRCVSDAVAAHEGSLKKAVEAGIAMPSGVPIRKVRCKVTPHTSLKEVRQHTDTPSRHDYKNPYYACTAPGTNTAIAVYAVPLHAKPAFIIENLFDHVKKQVPQPPDGAILQGRILPGSMALAVKSRDEKNIPVEKRLYTVGKFSGQSVTLWLHTEARAKKDLETALRCSGKPVSGSSSINFDNPHELLCLNLTKAWSSFLFEGIHFQMGLDGTINDL